jgi:hypothetical protein
MVTDKEFLDLVKRSKGIITLDTAVSTFNISVDEVKKILDRYIAQGLAIEDRTEVYVFPELVVKSYKKDLLELAQEKDAFSPKDIVGLGVPREDVGIIIDSFIEEGLIKENLHKPNTFFFEVRPEKREIFSIERYVQGLRKRAKISALSTLLWSILFGFPASLALAALFNGFGVPMKVGWPIALFICIFIPPMVKFSLLHSKIWANVANRVQRKTFKLVEERRGSVYARELAEEIEVPIDYARNILKVFTKNGLAEKDDTDDDLYHFPQILLK